MGLGEERLGPQYEPVLVESLAQAGEKIGSISCGNSHTLVLILSTYALALVRWGGRGGGTRQECVLEICAWPQGYVASSLSSRR